MVESDPTGTDDKPLEEEKFEELANSEEEEERPELDIPFNERKLLTQPFDVIVGSLEQQIKDGALILQDEFQRRRVWDDREASRLIESLLLNVPVPVCYFAELEDASTAGQKRPFITGSILAVLGARVPARFVASAFRIAKRIERPDLRIQPLRVVHHLPGL